MNNKVYLMGAGGVVMMLSFAWLVFDTESIGTSVLAAGIFIGGLVVAVISSAAVGVILFNKDKRN